MHHRGHHFLTLEFYLAVYHSFPCSKSNLCSIKVVCGVDMRTDCVVSTIELFFHTTSTVMISNDATALQQINLLNAEVSPTHRLACPMVCLARFQ